MTEPSTQRLQRLQSLLVVVGGGSAFSGLVMLLAWYLHWTALIQLSSKLSLIHYDTALAFLLSGLLMLALMLVIQQKIRLKRLNRDLSQSNLLLRATLEATADGILVLDAENRTINFNRRFAEMWRIPDRLLPSLHTGNDEQMLSFVLSQLKDPEAFQQSTRRLLEQLDKDTFDILEFKDGRVFERYSCPQWLGDRLVGRVLSFRDVTERRAAAAEIAHSLAVIQSTLESTTDGIVVLDQSWHILHYNQRFLELWNISDADIATGDDRLLVKVMQAQLHQPESFVQQIYDEHHTPTLSDQSRWTFVDGRVLERYSQPQWLGEDSIGRVVSYRDITDRLQSETALQEEMQRQAALLSVQHELMADRLSLDTTMNLIVEQTQQLTRASGAVIELVEGDELVYRAASGAATNYVGLRLQIKTSFSGRCLETGEILYCHDSETDPRVNLSACRAIGLRSMIVTPLHHQGTRIGVLKVLALTPSAFADRDIQTLQLMAGVLAAEISVALEFQAKQDALAALQESEERSRAVVSALNEGVIMQDAQGVICASNASAERILGLSIEQMMGRTSIDPCWQAIHEDGSPFPGQEHPSMITMQTGQPCHGVVMGVCKPDGNLTWISINSRPLVHPGEALPYAVVASFTDITERKQAEMLLRQSERRYRAIIEDQTELIIRYLPNGTLTFVNKAYCRYFGVAQAAIMGQRYAPLTLEDDREQVAQLVNAICLENPVITVENQVIVAGQVRWTQWINRGLFDSQGKLLELQAAGRDITERKQAEAALQESEQRLTLAFEGSGDGLWDWNIVTGELYLSPRYLEMLGYAVGELPDDLSTWQHLVNPEDQPWVLECLNAHIQDQRVPYRFDYRVLTRSGEWKWIANYGKVVVWDEAGNPLRMVGVHRDIDERKKIEQALFHEKELAQVTLQSIGDAVITTDALGNIKYFNPVAESLTGWKQSEVQGHPLTKIFHIIHEITRQPVENPVEQALTQNRIVELASHTVLIARDSSEVAIEDSAAPIHDRTGEIIGAVMVFHDVTQTRALSRQLVWQASHDALTGLVNRREFEQQLEQALSSARLYQQKHALCYLDLDRFKIVNDTCGHAAGDELLQQVTALLQAQIRKTDTLARLGGDEFGVLLHQCPPEQALRVANAMRECIQAFRFIYQGQSFAIGASIGLVGVTAESESLTSLLSSADAACYTAKNRGRNRVHVFQPDDEDLLQQRGEMQWVSRLTQALEDNQFCLYYQPIAAITDTGLCIDHYEVLLRLRGEQDSLISPMAFIPAAERYNLMHHIDRWVIRTLFSQWSTTTNSGKDTYAINLSGASLNDEEFVEFLYEQFAIYQIPPQSICFEITETVAIANLIKTNHLMRELQHIGCRFALDDFGSGMSSFGYLKHLSVDYLKIDGGFVKNIAADPVDAAMVEAITRIGHVMGIKTIAEFVEDDVILKRIKDIGVDYAQGYGIAAPHPYVLS